MVVYNFKTIVKVPASKGKFLPPCKWPRIMPHQAAPNPVSLLFSAHFSLFFHALPPTQSWST